MQKLNEDDARQGERQKLYSHVLIPSAILATLALGGLVLIYAL